MRRSGILWRLGLVLVFCLSVFVSAGSASGAVVPGNRCKDRCNERYNRRKDQCRGLRKWDRRQCEDRAKYERDGCKRRC